MDPLGQPWPRWLGPVRRFLGVLPFFALVEPVAVADPPPLNWSDLIVRIMKEDRYGEEDIQARGDCFEAASG